jgi:ABC-type bacteriocin/lantibiotic exporter with double-glycine peptidase domain
MYSFVNICTKGEKQRICLARALVRKPALLILDEYTSALDSLSESKVVESLKFPSSTIGPTIVIIGHRLATVKVLIASLSWEIGQSSNKVHTIRFY